MCAVYILEEELVRGESDFNVRTILEKKIEM